MQTERLILRRFETGDRSDIYEYLSDHEVVKFEPYPPLSEEQCEELLEQMMQSNDFWAICLQDSGKQIGQVYLAEKEQNNWELGYVLGANYQHNGYAFEAVKALISDVFVNGKAHRVFAHCNPENTPSWRLLERLNFRREGHLKQNIFFKTNEDGSPSWQDTFEYGILREEWI